MISILFDHGTPSGIAAALEGHVVIEAIDRGWDRISNGELLRVAEDAGFELLLTTDKNLPDTPTEDQMERLVPFWN